MIQRPNGTRYSYYYKLDKKLNEPYDYARNGVLNKIMSHQITSSPNPSLNIILQYFEKSLVFLMKYIDVLKNFKNIHYKNR